MSKATIPSLQEILKLIEEMKSFDVNDYVIITKDGKQQLDIAALLDNNLSIPISEFAIDNEKEYIYFKFENGQEASLNDEGDWSIKRRKPTGVYLIGSNGHVKIGISDNAKKRLKMLQTGSSVKLSLIGFWEIDDPVGVEKGLHSLYHKKRTQGEWFNLSAQDIDDIRRYLDGVNKQAT